MENKEYEELKDILKKENGSSDMSWLLLLMMLSFGNFGSHTSTGELAKVKEDVAELKGKISMLEKML